LWYKINNTNRYIKNIKYKNHKIIKIPNYDTITKAQQSDLKKSTKENGLMKRLSTREGFFVYYQE
jgi:hypothetical protein